MVAYLKLLIAKIKRERFGQSAKRGRKLLDQLELQLDQLELQLEELKASATEDEIAVGAAEPDPPGRCLCRFSRSLRCPAPGRPDHRGGLLEP
jgi:hypothetical protein